MQMCHSLRCRQLDMLTSDLLKSIFPNNARTPKLILVTEACNHIKTGWKTEGVIMNIECKESFTPRDVFLSIVQVHAGLINSKPFTSES